MSFGANTLEYEPEAQRIVPRLIACYSVEEFQAVIQEEICRSRGGAKAGLLADYAAVAQELWMNWQLQR